MHDNKIKRNSITIIVLFNFLLEMLANTILQGENGINIGEKRTKPRLGTDQ